MAGQKKKLKEVSQATNNKSKKSAHRLPATQDIQMPTMWSNNRGRIQLDKTHSVARPQRRRDGGGAELQALFLLHLDRSTRPNKGAIRPAAGSETQVIDWRSESCRRALEVAANGDRLRRCRSHTVRDIQEAT